MGIWLEPLGTYLAYIDDSGDSRSFALGVILVPTDERWLIFHDRLVNFRSRLSKQHDFLMSWELHATEIIGNSGKWRRTTTRQQTRNGIYKAALRLLSDSADLDVHTFGVVIADRESMVEPKEKAWTLVLERLETFTRVNDSTVLLIPDNGDPLLVRRLVRRQRRHHYVPSMIDSGPGTGLQRNFVRVVEDPLHRDSADSYEIQWADLVAYSAFRRLRGSAKFPPNMWEHLDESLLRKVNRSQRDEPDGLVTWPRGSLPAD